MASLPSLPPLPHATVDSPGGGFSEVPLIHSPPPRPGLPSAAAAAAYAEEEELFALSADGGEGGRGGGPASGSGGSSSSGDVASRLPPLAARRKALEAFARTEGAAPLTTTAAMAAGAAANDSGGGAVDDERAALAGTAAPPRRPPVRVPLLGAEPTSVEEQLRADSSVNEVHFSFLDGAPDTPSFIRGASGGSTPRLMAAAGDDDAAAAAGLVVEGGGGAEQGAAAAAYESAAASREGGGILQHLAGAGVPQSTRSVARLMVLLVLLGVIPSLIIFFVDVAVHRLFALREALAVDSGQPGGVQGFILYTASGLVLCLASTAVCHAFSTDAEGSGIPQMKAIMSGFYDKLKPALSLWALLAKCVGLVLAIGGGLPIGWEGPNVHIACIIAHHLSRLPFFRSLRRDRALRMQIMACACAVGLASSFGTPIGGVLYALETTASFYLVPTFWKSLLSTVAGALVYDMLYKTPLVEAFENTSFGGGDYTRTQLLAFALLGVLCGLVGAAFVKCVHWVYIMRKLRAFGAQRYVIVGLVATFAAMVQYPLRLFRLDPRTAINQFFSAEPLLSLSTWDVVALLGVKFPLIVVSIGLPLPAGVFIPCFLLGSAFGRLYGEVLKFFFGAAIVPGGYAVVGAAAFTAGVTRALSCAVVIFEVTGQLKHMVPTVVAVLLAVIVGNACTRSLYDTLIIMKQLPFMAHMRRDRHPRQTVADVMSPAVVSLPVRASAAQVQAVLTRHPAFDSVPVVADAEGQLLLGAVRRRSLIATLAVAADAAGAAGPYALRMDEDSDGGDHDGGGSGSEHAPDGGGGAAAASGAPVNGHALDTGGATAGAPSPESYELVDMRPPAAAGAAGAAALPEPVGSANGVPPPADPSDAPAAATDAAAGGGEAAGAAAAAPPPMAGLAPSHSAKRDAPKGGAKGDPSRIRHTAGDATAAAVAPRRAGVGSDGSGRRGHGGDGRLLRLRADLSPLVVTANTTLGQLHFMFVMLMPTHALVTNRGRLAGVVRRGDLIQSGQLIVPPPLPPPPPSPPPPSSPSAADRDRG